MQRGSRRRLLAELLRTGLLRPRSAWALAAACARSGTSLVALVRFGAAWGLADAAVVDERERVALCDLAAEAERLAVALRREFDVRPGQRVAILGANGVGFVRALLALSRLGARTMLVNPQLPAGEAARLLARHGVEIILAHNGAPDPAIGAGRRVCVPDDLLRQRAETGPALPRFVRSEIVVLTGGTTGLPKPARRSTTPAGVLRLFLHLMVALRLDRRRTVLIAVPLFHGYGLAALLVALALGRTVHLRGRFDGAEAAALIECEGVDTLVAVPTMLHRLIRIDERRPPLACIVCGGAPLSPSLLAEARERYGDILFNLYGTSEAGLTALATPGDLAVAPETIGRAVWGAEIVLRGDDGSSVANGAIGELFVRNRASVAAGTWVATGDLGRRDAHGRLFLEGRVDEMIVSGGENVHPRELETVLLDHPAIAQAAAVGVPDAEFGQRLAAFVVPQAGGALDPADIAAWLRPRIARHLAPCAIEVRRALPLTAIGKVDRRSLAVGEAPGDAD